VRDLARFRRHQGYEVRCSTFNVAKKLSATALMDESGAPAAGGDRVRQRGEGELPGDDEAREDVENDREVKPTFSGGQGR
jgi:hypothetical protein